jgi:ATP-dependent Lon protease
MTNAPRDDRETRLPAEKLAWRCDPASLDFETTAEIPPVEDIIGQARALRAIQLGLDIDSPGYNIYVAGFVGTGRATTIQHLLKRLDPRAAPPDDLTYVYNFSNPDAPKALFLPAGGGRVLGAHMKKILQFLRRDVPAILDSEASIARRAQLGERARAKQREIMKTFEKRCAADGFGLIQIHSGPMTSPDVAPLVGGEPKSLAEVEEMADAGTLDPAEFARIQEKAQILGVELQKVVRSVLKVEEELLQQVREHDAQAVRPLLTSLVDEVRERFEDRPEVLEHLDRVEEHVLASVRRFASIPGDVDANGAPQDDEARAADLADLELQVNVAVDNQNTRGAPVIVENMPTLARLFGMVERTWSKNGERPSDHMRIKAGSLHRANEGYLVLNASDVLAEPTPLWTTLKRTLRTGLLEIPGGETTTGLGPTGIAPEPVLIGVKAVMIGDLHTYSLLYEHDEDFQKIFKIRADFDVEMDNTLENIRMYGAFVERLARDEGLLSFDRAALARLAERGARLAGRQDKLSTRFTQIADYVREASYFARKDGKKFVEGPHVERAFEERDVRGRLSLDHLQQMIREGSIFIDVEGARVGQVNGLSVYDIGEHVFGVPVKITATVGMGTAGIINIEREAELSGRTHDKGMQILAGYLRAKYAQDKPLTLSASVCFEQSYSGIDGDSASSTELYAILSALAGIPIRQDFAVTGSVNQNGEIQPIGDVNEKIEGFFDVCKLKNFTGTQGMLVPTANVPDLMLHSRVVAAVAAGTFQVHAVSTIDEGISFLTGMPPGELRGKGRYPRDTVNGRVDARLRALATHMREFGGHP